MKRSGVGLEAIANFGNLATAFHAAAKGKRERPDVLAFAARLEHELGVMRAEILDGSIAVGEARAFRIRDPKPRTIHAPAFRERVLHHAVMAHVGPVLDRSLIFDTYACRMGKGALAAVKRVRDHAGQYAWYTQIDIAGYFPHIDHEVLLGLLERKFKNRGLLSLVSRIVGAHEDGPGRGLPIGALTSQHFANFYLASTDRLLLGDPTIRGFVRYMDDLIWWTDDRADGRRCLEKAARFLADRLRLTVKTPVRAGWSRHGIVFCGYRIARGRLLLTRRRKRSYRRVRRLSEAAWLDGRIDANELQAAHASALAVTSHADALSWRREALRRAPVAAALDAA